MSSCDEKEGEKGWTAVCLFFICNPRKSPEEVPSVFIDISLRILLKQLICRANRGLGRIYLILFPLAGYITYPTSRPAAKQVSLVYWQTQTKSIQFIGGPKLNIKFLLLYFSSASISSHSRLLTELLLYGPFISICLPYFYFSLNLPYHYFQSSLHLPSFLSLSSLPVSQFFKVVQMYFEKEIL